MGNAQIGAERFGCVSCKRQKIRCFHRGMRIAMYLIADPVAKGRTKGGLQATVIQRTEKLASA